MRTPHYGTLQSLIITYNSPLYGFGLVVVGILVVVVVVFYSQKHTKPTVNTKQQIIIIFSTFTYSPIQSNPNQTQYSQDRIERFLYKYYMQLSLFNVATTTTSSRSRLYRDSKTRAFFVWKNVNIFYFEFAFDYDSVSVAIINIF